MQPPPDLVLRPAAEADIETIKAITVTAFEPVSLDHNSENALGLIDGRPWFEHKWRSVSSLWYHGLRGTFVAERAGRVVGYIQTVIHPEASKGHITNLAIDVRAHGQGIGRALIEHAKDWFRAQGLQYALIETLEQNPTGKYLYPSCGFQEVGRNIHYIAKL